MESNANEAHGGARWFYLVGAIAVLFSYILFRTDEALTHSPREKVLGQTLRELRTAQASLGNISTVDPRLSNAVSNSKDQTK